MIGSLINAIIVGLGNIGSHLAVLLARSGCVACITVIDPDRYELRNLSSQDITARDVGLFKATVAAKCIHRINPEVRVVVIPQRVEVVPLGLLRADVIATALDGLAARRWVSRAAWRLGIPLVDAGVRAEGLLARVDVFTPTPNAACFECGWSDVERASVDNRYPCDPPATVASTGAPAYLGSIAASLQCAEIVKLLSGDTQCALSGRQLMVDAMTHHHYVSVRRRAPDCGFDHRQWAIQRLGRSPGRMTLGQASRLVSMPHEEGTRLRVDGEPFVHRLTCPSCHTSRETLFLAGRLDDAARQCRHCGTPMLAAGIDTTDTLALDRLAGVQRRSSLYALGLRRGDVFSIEGAAGETHFEIGGR